MLIVEDEALTAMTLQGALEDAGYAVLEIASRFEQAAAIAHARKPDMALLNIRLHGKDDGIPLAVEFKAMGIPVLFISGQGALARSCETGAMGSLPKPYSAVNMVLAVSYLFGRMDGDTSLPRPAALELFAAAPKG